jgi:hypothetical protein
VDKGSSLLEQAGPDRRTRSEFQLRFSAAK